MHQLSIEPVESGSKEVFKTIHQEQDWRENQIQAEESAHTGSSQKDFGSKINEVAVKVNLTVTCNLVTRVTKETKLCVREGIARLG